jgi:hypothetical protein
MPITQIELNALLDRESGGKADALDLGLISPSGTLSLPVQ